MKIGNIRTLKKAKEIIKKQQEENKSIHNLLNMMANIQTCELLENIKKQSKLHNAIKTLFQVVDKEKVIEILAEYQDLKKTARKHLAEKRKYRKNQRKE